jgi:hypothetical protein
MGGSGTTGVEAERGDAAGPVCSLVDTRVLLGLLLRRMQAQELVHRDYRAGRPLDLPAADVVAGDT